MEAHYRVKFVRNEDESSFRVTVTDNEAEPDVIYDCTVAAEDLCDVQRKALHDMARFFNWIVGRPDYD